VHLPASISQSRFPRAWEAFQYLVGGTVDKRKLLREHYRGERRILEVGCSVGNTAAAFVGLPDISYTGVDIDPAALNLARNRFARFPSFRFVCQDLLQPDASRPLAFVFDLVFFAGVCHHLDARTCTALLERAPSLLAPDGRVVVVEPLLPRTDDPLLVRQFIRLEQGRHVLTGAAFERLLRGLEGLELCELGEHLVGATPWSVPACARFGVYVLRPVCRSSQAGSKRGADPPEVGAPGGE
jgi:SAM-dependent methyltransferase